MKNLDELKAGLVKLLTLELSGRCDVLAAWPDNRAAATSRPLVCVGLDGIALAPSGLGGLTAVSRENPGMILITVRLDLYEPGSGAGKLHGLYEDLCGALLKQASNIGLTGITCEPLCREEALRSWRLPAKAVLKAAMTGPPSSEPVMEEGKITHLDVRRG